MAMSISRCFYVAFLPFVLLSQHSSYFDDVEVPRVAVIGGGIGGSTVAYQLSKIFGSHLTTLDVYESKKVGGRIQTIAVNGLEYEIGGSVIHPANQYMVGFAKLFGLSHREDHGDGSFAMFRGDEKVFEVSSNSWLSTLQLMWRYGFNLVRMGRNTDHFLTDFDRIYSWQKEHQTFTTVPHLLMAMSDDLMNATKMTLREQLYSVDISKQLVDELAMAAVRNNYAQTPDGLHGFVGAVSLAGAQPGLWSVKGGNKQVPEQLLKTSNARVVKSSVVRVTNASTDSTKPLYRVELADGSSAEYDVIVLAFPLVQGQANVEFEGFNTDMNEHERKFQHVRVYIVDGVPNYKHFGYESLAVMPSMITPIGENEFYNTVEEIFPVNGEVPEQRIWKVFADNLLSQKQLDTLFLSRKTTELIEWFAYPQYEADIAFVPFVLAPRMYYVNAIELAASAMEMSALSAMNVAYLATHDWMGHDHLIDNMFVIEDKHIKIEL